MSQKTVLITGASSGIGKACAERFAENNFNLIITGRRKDRLELLSEELQSKCHVKVLILNFDVRERNQVESLMNALPEEWQKIDILINNAGLAAGRDNFVDALIEDWETMVDTNLKGLAYVTKAVLPYMLKAGNGHIINIGSTAGKEVYALGNMYCATKHAVTALSESMRIDLLKHNIKVTAIHPGATETEFAKVRFKGDEDKAAKTYDGILPLSGDDVAQAILYCAQLPPHVCINDLVITCTQQANSYYTFRTES
ncbi:MAG TPA: SDR family NAD(P)-dependent oxidoreductase [Niabella sp.]|nr:SDR family NAD(P)-dependent oxidoreductase [Niabella sp.]HOZ97512.1 SDR family NAD(P)-dependent oxidoreductase [Niabella sp.]HQW15600.1 SDR family NAD(P)-dependent oxidoreductase [Niabella sp.]HQX20743.1 SDR family NAD(P)-dependent oxidoreductase [Niabella sp.]HQX42619.1 SDR family NAD(P)-dependent oxidoreductase [Niabella sp.]